MNKKFTKEQLDNPAYSKYEYKGNFEEDIKNSKYKFGEPEYDDNGNLNMHFELVEDENYNFCVDIFDDNDTEEEMFIKIKKLQDKIRKITDKNQTNTDEIDYHAPLPSFESIQEYNKTLNIDDFKDITYDEPISIDIDKMQSAIDSGFVEAPRGLTPEKLLEFIKNS